MNFFFPFRRFGTETIFSLSAPRTRSQPRHGVMVGFSLEMSRQCRGYMAWLGTEWYAGVKGLLRGWDGKG